MVLFWMFETTQRGLFDDVDFVDAHPFRRLEADGLLKLVDVVAEDVADRSFDHAGFVGQRGEGAFQCLLPDPLHQSVGHHPVLGQQRQCLREGLAAGLATQPLGVDVNAHALAVHGQVFEHLLAGAPRVQAVGLAMRAGSSHFHRLGGDMVVVVGFLNPQHPVLRKVQDVRGHGQARRMYSKR